MQGDLRAGDEQNGGREQRRNHSDSVAQVSPEVD